MEGLEELQHLTQTFLNVAIVLASDGKKVGY